MRRHAHARPQTLRARAKANIDALRREIVALWLAYRHPDTPWYAKAWVAVVVGYALSPIDLIPDFIPVIGLLDDLLLVPLGIWVALKLIPAHVMAQAREAAQQRHALPRSRVAAAVIVCVWLAASIALGAFVVGYAFGD